MMSRYCHPFWMGFTIVLSVVFVALAFPLFVRRMGAVPALFATVFCLALIWLRYIFIGWMFTRRKRGDEDTHAENGYV